MKVDRVVVKETRYLTIAVALCSLVMQGVFLIIGKYDWTVLTGSLLGGVAAVLNFWFMGMALQRATAKEDPAEAKKQMRASYNMRYLFLGAVVVVAAVTPYFHWVPVVLSLIFPRLWFLVMPLFRKDLKEEQVQTETEKIEKPEENPS